MVNTSLVEPASMCLQYTTNMLWSLRPVTLKRPTQELWSLLKGLDINRLTQRGTRAGRRLIRPISTINRPRYALECKQTWPLPSVNCQPRNVNKANLVLLHPPAHPITEASGVTSIQVHVSSRPDPHNHHVSSASSCGANFNNIICPSISSSSATQTPPCGVSKSKVALLNARSAKQQNATANKPAEIHDLIIDNALDLLVITETWLSGDGTDTIAAGDMVPPGYSIKSIPRIGRRGGGLALIYRSVMKLVAEDQPSYTTFECFVTTVVISSQSLKLCALYKPPKFGVSSLFLEELSTLAEQLSTSRCEVLLMGDFNIHVDVPTQPESAKFLSLLESTNLQQHVSLPTHQNGHTLDLVITRSQDLNITAQCTDGTVSSDHLAVIFTLEVPKPARSRKTITTRKWNSIPTDSFSADISSSELSANSTADVNTAVELYNKTLKELSEKHAPPKTINIMDRPNTAWYNADIRLAKQQLRKAERKWRSTGLMVHREIFRSQRIQLNLLRDSVKTTYYTTKIESASDLREVQQVMNTLLHKQKASVLPSHSSPTDMAERFASYFTEKINIIRSDIPQQSNPSVANAPINIQSVMSSFRLATEEEITKLIAKSKPKTSSLDPIPTRLVKDCQGSLVPIITHIVNLSLSTGTMPDQLKDAVITPILKKTSLDKEQLKNFRPVSNLAFVSKLIERVIADRFLEHLEINNINNKFQSAYKKGHSTETALLRVQNDILDAVDTKGAAILIQLDLSAAFDTLDQDVLLRSLQDLGISGCALAWFSSYLKGRHQSVVVSGEFSGRKPLQYGVPQGSVLGPLLFTTYTMPLSSVITAENLEHHLYADDSNLYLAFSPVSAASKESAVQHVQSSACVIKGWMDNHFLKLNEQKTEILVISSPSMAAKADIPSLNICGSDIKPSKKAKGLGVTYDSCFNMESHVSNICRGVYHEIYKISKIRKYLTENAVRTLVNATVTSRVDYCNSLLYGIPVRLRNRLQHAHNAAARLIARTRKHEHITPVLVSLHWLPMEQRISYKILILTYRALNGLAPEYLADLLHTYRPSRSLRSEDSQSLMEPRYRLKTYGYRSFQCCAPRLWNTLPVVLRRSETLGVFKRNLKTHLFKAAYDQYLSSQ